MAKVLLVEDDNNLREIYQARLQAEGYQIVAAQNGEEALVVAKQNKPDLIISDVMMPRISGFEMLDILRNTDELKHTKIIMLTALGQAEDQKRADSLGADRYLVKSQVTLEDIVNAAKSLMQEDGTIEATPAAEAAPARPAPVPITPSAADVPVVSAPEPVAPEPAASTNPAAPSPAPAGEPAAPAATTPSTPDPSSAAAAAVTAEPTTPHSAVPEPAVTEPPVVEPLPAPIAAIPEPTSAAPSEIAVPVPAPSVVPERTSDTSVATAPQTTPNEPTVAAPSPTADPQAAVADAGAQSLQAEEEALQAQISNYATAPYVEPPAVPTGEAADQASNDETISEAVDELNAPITTEPVLPPSIVNAEKEAEKAAADSDNQAAEAQPATAPPVAAPEVVVPEPVVPEPPATTTESEAGTPQSIAGKKIIQPLNDINAKPRLNELLAKEGVNTPPAAPAAAPKAVVVNTDAAAASTPVAPATPGQSFDPNTAL